MTDGREPANSRIVRAYKYGWPRMAVHRMAVWKLRGGFAHLWAQGLEEFRAAIDADPSGTLILANHSAWWDLFFVDYLNQTVPLDGYGMMEHFNLRRFGFFRRIGAFSVDRTDPRSVRESLAYSLELLEKPRSAVWIFPQGKILSNDHRPLSFQPGLRALVRRTSRIRIATVAFRYEFWQDERPEAFVRFGRPEWVDRDEADAVIPTWEARLTETLDTLRTDALSQETSRFTSLMAGGRSISEKYAAFRATLFGKTPGVPETSTRS